MKRHTNKNIKSFGVSGVLVLAVVAAAGLFVNPTWAEKSGTGTATVNFTFNSKIQVDLGGAGESGTVSLGSVNPGAGGESEDITFTVSSNSPTGYYISATAGDATSTALKSEGVPDFEFKHLSTSVEKDDVTSLDDNTWGVMITGGNSDVSNGKYVGLPQEDGGDDVNTRAEKGAKLLSADSSAAEQTLKVKVGAKVGAAAVPGTYTGYLNFYAVTQ